MTRSLRAIVPLAVLALAAAALAYLLATRSEIERQPSRERLWPVAAVEVVHGDARPVLKVYGEVVAGREVELRALVAGVVAETGPGLVEGGVVKKGDLIVAIDEFDVRSALDDRQAQLREARARLAEIEARRRGHMQAIGWERQELDLLQRDFDRATALRARGNVSEKFLDNARMALFARRRVVVAGETDIAADAARIDQQRAIIKRLEVQLSQAERDLEETKLTAPFDGFLHTVVAAAGKRLGVGDRVATLLDANRLEARVHLSNRQFGRLAAAGEELVGRALRIDWQVGERRNEYAARIERVGARIDSASGGVELYARIESSGIADLLRPGAFVEVRLPGRLYEKVVRVPETALHGDTVYAIVDGRLEARTVTVVAREGTSALLLGDLVDGEIIVTTRFPEIAPSLKVEVR